MNKILKIFVIALLATHDLMAQSSFIPSRIDDAVNSKYVEINPVLSPDGKTLYFTRANTPQSTWGGDINQDIWCSTLQEDGKWSPAVRMSKQLNIGQYNAVLSVLDNGNTLLINGQYTHGVFSKKIRTWFQRGMSFVYREKDGTWSAPQAIDIKGYNKMNKGETSTAYMTPDQRYLFMAFSVTPIGLKNRLFVSQRISGKRYSKPKQIKFQGDFSFTSCDAPFLSANGKDLYFSSNNGSRYDIYVAHRLDNSYRKWSEPKALTDTVNIAKWQCYYKLNSEESWAYYCVSLSSQTDIFKVKVYEPNPYIKLKGKIINNEDKTPLLKDTTYKIDVEGGNPLLFSINRNDATYELQLPFGAKYNIKPQLDGWIGVDFEYDATKAIEYAEVEQDIAFDPIPFVKIKGRFINNRTGQVLQAEHKPVVLINNQPSDSVHYDYVAGTYEATLPLGENYYVSASLPYYSAAVDSIDARNLRAFLEKDIDFKFVSVPYVEVRGIAMDNITFTPIPGEVSPKLMVDGVVQDSVLINSLTGEFSVLLPFGKVYKTSISSKSYKEIDNVLDLSEYQEYAVVKHTVFGENRYANMATLHGKIINLKTGQPLDRMIPAKLKVNGTETPGFNYDSTTANYTLKLLVGSSYDIMPSVKNFYNKYELVDLTKVRKGAKLPRNFYVTPIEVGQSVNIDFIYFDTGKSTLKPASFRSLNALVEFLKEYPNVIVEIGGHTDNTGSKSMNQRLSESRAKSVADYVLSMGISTTRITSRGYNFEKPKESNKTAKGRAANRRVEFTIVGV